MRVLEPQHKSEERGGISVRPNFVNKRNSACFGQNNRFKKGRKRPNIGKISAFCQKCPLSATFFYLPKLKKILLWSNTKGSTRGEGREGTQGRLPQSRRRRRGATLDGTYATARRPSPTTSDPFLLRLKFVSDGRETRNPPLSLSPLFPLSISLMGRRDE